jgi:hypothetical protein
MSRLAFDFHRKDLHVLYAFLFQTAKAKDKTISGKAILGADA